MTRNCIALLAVISPLGFVGSLHSQVLTVGVFNGLLFSASADSPITTPAQQVMVGSSFGSIPFQWSVAQVTQNRYVPNFLTITPSSGVTPATVSIALNPNVVPYLPPDPYTIGVEFTSTDPAHPGGAGFLVNLLLGEAGPVTVSSVVNSATQQTGPLSPGEIITIYGSLLGTQPASATYTYSTGWGGASFYPASLGNTTVTIAGEAFPLLFVSPTQINAVVPYDLGSFVTNPAYETLVVTHNTFTSTPFNVQFADTGPGIFTVAPNGQGPGAISNVNPQTGAITLNNAANPAPKGSTIVLYGTGAGVWQQSPADGQIITNVLDPPFYIPSAPVSLTIGGQPATLVYAGAAPGQVSGLLQINAVVPSGIASGAQPVVLTIGGSSNVQQGVTIAVQ